MPNEFGKYMKAKRIAQDMTLREFCAEHGYDPPYISRLERGVEPPPDMDEVQALAWCLGFYSDHEAQAKFLKLAESGREAWIKPYVASVTMRNNGFVFARDKEGQAIELCQGFILDKADWLRKCCDENTTWFIETDYHAKTGIHADFSWWWREGHDASSQE